MCKRPQSNRQIDIFRRSKEWEKKSIEIKERDRWMCVVCKNNLYDTVRQYNSENLETHHITPLKESYKMRTEGGNLVTLCTRHHKMAERGQIPRDVLRTLIQ